MTVHPISDEEKAAIKSKNDRMPVTALLRVEGRTIPTDEPLSDEDASALKAGGSEGLTFALQALGMRLGDAVCSSVPHGDERAVRWELLFETHALDRIASAYRGLSWRNGLVGSAMRGIWRAGESLHLAEKAPDLAALLQPQEFLSLRWDSSRDKEKDRAQDLPLVNMSETGGGGSPIKRPAKSGAKAKKR